MRRKMSNPYIANCDILYFNAIRAYILEPSLTGFHLIFIISSIVPLKRNLPCSEQP